MSFAIKNASTTTAIFAKFANSAIFEPKCSNNLKSYQKLHLQQQKAILFLQQQQQQQKRSASPRYAFNRMRQIAELI